MKFKIIMSLIFSMTLLFGMEIKSVILVSNMNDGFFSDESKTTSIDNTAKLSFVLKTSEGYFSEEKNIKLNDEFIEAKSFSDKLEIHWYKVEEAEGEDYNNCKPEWHWDEMPYIETEISNEKNNAVILVNSELIHLIYCFKKLLRVI